MTALKEHFEVTESPLSHDQPCFEIKKESLISALNFLKSEGYSYLIDLTAVDYINPAIRTQVIYFLHNPKTLERVQLFVWVGRDESIPSVTSLWEGANWYERELFDLFGIQFTGHPDLTRILMPDDWSGHPLRRDYPLTEEPVAFKNHVSPKVPSQIIHIRKEQKYKQ